MTAMSSVTFGDEPAPLVTDAFQGEKEQTSGQKTKKRRHNKKIPEQEEEDIPDQVLEMLNVTELEKVKKKKKKHPLESENQEPTAEVSELREPETKKKKHKDSRSTVMVLPTEHLTETSLGENSVTVDQDTETSVLDASTAEGGRQEAKKKRAEQHPHPPEPAETPVLGEMERKKERKKKRRRTEQLPDSPVLGEVRMEGEKKTEQLPDSPVQSIAETEKGGQKMSKKRTEQLPDSPMLGEMDTEGQKKKKRRTEQLPDSSAPATTLVLREVEMERQKKKRTEQLPDSPVSVLGETEKERQKRRQNKKIPEQEEEDIPEQVLEMLNVTELEKVKKKKKKKKHQQESENQEPTAEVSELREPETKKKKKKHKDSRSTVMVLPTEHLTETSLGENYVTVDQDTETSVLDASTAEGGGQEAKKKRAEQHPHPPEPAATPVLGEMERQKERKKKKRRTEQLPDSPVQSIAETEKGGQKMSKKRTEQLPDSPMLGEMDTEGQKKKKKKRRTEQLIDSSTPAATLVLREVEMERQKKKRTEQLSDSPVSVLGETEKERQKRRQNKKVPEPEEEDIPEQVLEMLNVTELEKVRKKKKKKKHRQESENQESTAEVSELREPETKKKKKKHKDSRSKVMVLPTEHLTETSLGENSVTVDQDTETSVLDASTAEGGRQEAKKKRAEQHPHPPETAATPVLGERERQKERKKWRTEQLPDSSAPAATLVLREVEMERQKKQRTEQLPDSTVSVLGETEKERQKKKRTEQLPDSTVSVLGETEKERQKKKRTEQLPDSTVSVLGETEKERQKKKRTEQLPDSTVSVLGETEKERRKEKMQNREDVVMEVVTECKKKTHDGAKGVTDERMSERQTDEEESQMRTRETGTQHEAKCIRVKEEVNGSRRDFTVEEYMEELKEFVPNIKSKSRNQIRKLIKYDLERFKSFKSQGIPLRSGRFRDEENKRLTRNVSDFLALTGVESPTHLFYPKRFKDQYTHIKRLRSQHKFLDRIAEGIPRSWHAVYERGRRMFDKNNYKGRFTEEELHQLKELQRRHANNWKKISLEKHFSLIASASNTGLWSVEETSRLMDVMRDYLRGLTEPAGENQMNGEVIRKEKLYKDILWRDISHKVQTRSLQQCKEKWMCLLKKKMAPGRQAVFSKGRGFKGTQAKIDLIERMYAMQVEDAADIDWDKVAESMGNVTPFYVQLQFYRLKKCKVPLWKQMTYGDTIDFLYKNVLPEFRKHLTKTPLREESLEQRADPKEYFLLSDIFSEESEVDNVNKVSMTTGKEPDPMGACVNVLGAHPECSLVIRKFRAL